MLRADVQRVAVLGCGHGHLAVQLALVFPHATVAGFDEDAQAVAEARRVAAQAGVASRVTFEVSDMVLGDGYDVVCARVR